MKYQVIARKFRPQVFGDVVGQRPIIQTLLNAIEMDRIGHAYLFCGPRGVGKTTTARLLAKALNCTKGPTTEPCNECPSCKEISIGQSIDVLEIDAASNTGVDSIRELRENARYAPSRDRNKIFIVDEVHMLSTSAFNALLKILEEPPPHISFIMATTERHKLPATILSRCQQFVFRTIPPAEILEHLKKIGEREKIQIGTGGLEYIVKAAEGSMRDAQSLLDQIIAYGGQEIEDDEVRHVLGFVPTDILNTTIDALVERNSVGLLAVIQNVVDQGLNLQQFVREFLVRIRELLLAKLEITDKILATPEQREIITAQANHFSEQDLIRFFDILLSLENDLRWTSEPQFHLEVGFIKLAKIGQLKDIEQVIRDLTQPTQSSHDSNQLIAKEKPIEPHRNDVPKKKPTKLDQKIISEVQIKNNPSKTPHQNITHSEPVAPTKNDSIPQSSMVQFEEDFRKKVLEFSEIASLHLQDSDSINIEDGDVEIKVSIDSALEALETPECKQALEKAASEVLGRKTPVSLVLDSESGTERKETNNNSLQDSAKNETLVRSFLEVFKGEIAQIKDAKNASKPGK